MKRAVTTVATLLLLLVLGPPAYAVDEGVPDRDRHPTSECSASTSMAAGPSPPRSSAPAPYCPTATS